MLDENYAQNINDQWPLYLENINYLHFQHLLRIKYERSLARSRKVRGPCSSHAISNSGSSVPRSKYRSFVSLKLIGELQAVSRQFTLHLLASTLSFSYINRRTEFKIDTRVVRRKCNLSYDNNKT